MIWDDDYAVTCDDAALRREGTTRVSQSNVLQPMFMKEPEVMSGRGCGSKQPKSRKTMK